MRKSSDCTNKHLAATASRGKFQKEKKTSLMHVILWFFARLMKSPHSIIMFTISLQEFSHKVEKSHRGIRLNQLFNLYRAKLASVSEAGKMDYFIGCLQPCIKTVGSFFYSITLQEHILADSIQMTGKQIVWCLDDLNIPLLAHICSLPP